MSDNEQEERTDQSCTSGNEGIEQDQAEATSGATSCKLDNNRHRARSGSFLTWLGRQSLPRLLGLLVSDTRALEARLADKDARLADKDKEIEWLRARLDMRSSSGVSVVNDQEDRASTSVKSSPSPSTQSKLISPILSYAYELDRMKELFLYDPNEVERMLADLAARPSPKNKQIISEYMKWLDGVKIEDTSSDSGVVIFS